MDQLANLFLDRRDDLGVAMSGRTHGDARVAIQENVAVRICDPNAARMVGNKDNSALRIERRLR